MHKNVISYLSVCLGSITLLGCVGSAERVSLLAKNHGFEKIVVQGKTYKHVVFVNGDISKSQKVYIYIEGDGSPKINRHIVASDPTPRNPLMLNLMAEASMPSVYLGRSCYFGMYALKECSPEAWTSHRYSEEVVNSMVLAVENLGLDNKELVLLGHSGGGVIATLMAENLENVRAVITLAANLDIDKWAELHAYDLLAGSLNPADRPPLKNDIYQLHIAGDEDKNVPPRLIAEYVEGQRGARFRLFKGQDHSCCWHQVWGEILEDSEIAIY